MRRTALALLLASILAFASCGGGSNETESETGFPDAATGASQPSSAAAKGDRKESPGGKGEELARGGEASIEDFGFEASGAQRKEIQGAFSGYLNALAEEDYATACSYLSATVQSALEQLAVKELKGEGCGAILPKLLSPTAGKTARQQANGQITKVRVQDERGFVVFHAPGAELYQQTMVSEGGEWKVATVATSVLVPSL